MTATTLNADQRQAHCDECDVEEKGVCEICDSTCGDCYGGMDDPNYHCPHCGSHVDGLNDCPECDGDTCSECGDSLDDGEGYDGLCGNCADKTEEEE